LFDAANRIIFYIDAVVIQSFISRHGWSQKRLMEREDVDGTGQELPSSETVPYPAALAPVEYGYSCANVWISFIGYNFLGIVFQSGCPVV